MTQISGLPMTQSGTVTHRTRVLLKRIVRRSPAQLKLDPLAEKARLAARIAEYAEDSMVAYVGGGIDCDGCRWDNEVTVLPATLVAVERHIQQRWDDAEGPMWGDIARVSECTELVRESRDLALEAFEDGHPFTLRS